MEWTVVWSRIDYRLNIPALKLRFERKTQVLVPLALFDIKIFQSISSKSGESLLWDIQNLKTYPMSKEQAKRLNEVLKRDCAFEYGHLRLESGPGQLASHEHLCVIAKKINDLREREFVDPNGFSLFEDLLKVQSGWLAMNDCDLPYVQRSSSILLLPKKMVLRICGATCCEEIEGWMASSTESLVLSNQLRSAGCNLPRDDTEFLVSLQQIVIIFRHKIFNGPKIPNNESVKIYLTDFPTSSSIDDLSENSDRPVSSLRQLLLGNPSLNKNQPAVIPNAANPTPPSWKSTHPSALNQGVLILRKVEVYSVSMSVSFCLAHLQSCEVDEPDLSLPCFSRCPWTTGATVMVEETRRQFFPLWKRPMLLKNLRRFITHSKLILVDPTLSQEYNKVFHHQPIFDATYAVDLRALLASLMLLRMEYRSSFERQARAETKDVSVLHPR